MKKNRIGDIVNLDINAIVLSIPLYQLFSQIKRRKKIITMHIKKKKMKNNKFSNC